MTPTQFGSNLEAGKQSGLFRDLGYTLGFYVSNILQKKLVFQSGVSMPSLVFNKEGSSPGAQLDHLRYGEKTFFWVPVDQLVSGIGTGFTVTQHQYVRFFLEGKKALDAFYGGHRPTNTFSMVFLDTQGPKKLDGIYRQPWSENAAVICSRGGGQYYGPNHQRRIHYESLLLNRIQRSIQRRGLERSEVRDFSLPRFRLLVNDLATPHDYRAIVEGNHRVSALTWLGWRVIPMEPSRQRPREIRLSDLESWPGVKDGTFSKKQARMFFDWFFRDQSLPIFQDWASALSSTPDLSRS